MERKCFFMGRVATGLYGVSPVVVGEIGVICRLRDGPGDVDQNYLVNDMGEVFSLSVNTGREKFNDTPIRREDWEYVGRRVHDYPEGVNVKKCLAVAKKFRRQAEDRLRKGGFCTLFKVQNIIDNSRFFSDWE